MIRRAGFALGLALLAALPARAADPRDFAKGWADFYTRDYGSLAILQNSDRDNPLLQVVDSDSPLTVNRRGVTTLAINHANRGGNDTRRTYVAVLVLLVHSGDQRNGKPALTVFRNPGWFRSWCHRQACFDNNGTSQVIGDPQVLSALAQKRTDGNEGSGELAIDQLLQVPFDGQVQDRDELDSWARRTVWNADAREAACRGANTTCERHYYLLSFAPSTGHANSTPLYFDFNSWSTTQAIIYTFSPTEDLLNDRYVIAFH